MNLVSDIDFSLPLHLDILQRLENGKELITEMTLYWSSIDYILNYYYEDHWNEFDGPKYYLRMVGGPEFLVYGDYQQMKLSLIAYAKWQRGGGEDEGEDD